MRRLGRHRLTGFDRWSVAIAGATAMAFVIVVAGSSLSDDQHSVVRDPVSYFGAAEAPAPTLFAVTLAGLGAAVAVLGTRRLPRPVGAGLLVVGAGAVLLALLPVDCSPVDDACEVVVRAGADSASHDLHGYIGFVLHLAVVATAGFAARRRPLGRGSGATAVVLVLLVATLAPIVLLFTRPFEAGLGAAQLLGFAAAAVLVVIDDRRI